MSLISEEAELWLLSSQAVMAILNDVLELTHPELYQAGKEILARLREDELTNHKASLWSSVFTGISVMANRLTKPHIDRNGSHAWYDVLTTIGSYSNATLHLQELGLDLHYPSGTVVAFCANLLTHEVDSWGEGDRICYAMFMRKAVLRHFGKDAVGWMTQGFYSQKI